MQTHFFQVTFSTEKTNFILLSAESFAGFKGHKKFRKGYISLETKTLHKFSKNLFLKVEGGNFAFG